MGSAIQDHFRILRKSAVQSTEAILPDCPSRFNQGSGGGKTTFVGTPAAGGFLAFLGEIDIVLLGECNVRQAAFNPGPFKKAQRGKRTITGGECHAVSYFSNQSRLYEH
jgi:hypothetical protein